MMPIPSELVISIVRTGFLSALLVSGNVAVSAAEESCKVIRFKPGSSSAEIAGTVHPDKPLPCYRFTTGKGQTVRLTVQSRHGSIGFTINDLVDNRADYTFQSQKKTYEFNVHQTFRAVEPENYRLMLSIR